MRNVHTHDRVVRRQVYERIGNLRRSEAADLATVSFARAIDHLWPSADGWQILTIDSHDQHLLVLLEHPERGIAVTQIKTTLGDRPASDGTWDDLPAPTRDQYLWDACHAHGQNRLDLIEAIDTTDGGLNTRAARLLLHLTLCPVFLDEATTVMLGLGVYEDLLHDAYTVMRAVP